MSIENQHSFKVSANKNRKQRIFMEKRFYKYYTKNRKKFMGDGNDCINCNIGFKGNVYKIN